MMLLSELKGACETMLQLEGDCVVRMYAMQDNHRMVADINWSFMIDYPQEKVFGISSESPAALGISHLKVVK